MTNSFLFCTGDPGPSGDPFVSGDPCPSDAVFCSNLKRGALTRQACVDQFLDPWVQLPLSTTEDLSEVHYQKTITHRISTVPATMSDEDDVPQLNVSTTKNAAQKPSEPKMAPPVAPKPAWFRQSLKKIRDDQEQKKKTQSSELRPAAGFSRSAGGRSGPAASGMAVRQKINSFELFSDTQEEKGGIRRPVVEKKSLYPTSQGDHMMSKSGFPKLMESDRSKPTSASSGFTSATHEGHNPESKPCNLPSAQSSDTIPGSSEDVQPSNDDIQPSNNDVQLSNTTPTDLDSVVHDTPIDSERKVLSSKESESNKADTSFSMGSRVQPTPASGRSGPHKEEMGSETTGPPTESQALRDEEEEQMVKIIAFTNQVISLLKQC